MSGSDAPRERQCPWCGQATTSQESLTSNAQGALREVRCAACHGLLSVRLVEANSS